jgi:hypothetical protein
LEEKREERRRERERERKWPCPSHRREQEARCSTAAFPKLFTFREAGFSCYNVSLLPENCCPTSLFTTGYKRVAEGGCKVF